MNHKIKYLPIVTLGLSIFCLVGAFFSFLVLGNSANRLPSDYSYKASLDSQDNIFDNSRGQFSGSQSSRSSFEYNTVSVDGETLLLKNSFNVKTLSGQEIVNIERDYAINRSTREHQQYAGIKDRNGYLFAPTNLEKGQNYSYWHTNYDTELEMQFVGEESLLGVKVFHYTTDFEVDQTDELSSQPEVPEKYSVKLKVSLDTWVEPKTGSLVNYRDSAEADYYDINTGEYVKPWNRFANKFTQPSIEEQVNSARKKRDNIRSYSFVIPVTLIIIALLLFVATWIDYRTLNSRMPIIVFIAGATISIFVIAGINRNVQIEKQAEYDRKTSSLETEIVRRMNSYDDALHATQGFLNGSAEVSSSEWNEFTTDLNLQNRLPGILGIGLSVYAGDEDKLDAFNNQYRNALGFEDFAVWPTTEKDNHAIVYLEPLHERNSEAIGYNMFSEPTRQAAMTKAAESGEPVLSGSVTLVQEIDEDVQKGFLLYLPQYERSGLSTTPELRLESLKGFVYSPFRAGDFVESVINETDKTLRFEIFSEEVKEDNKIYSNISSANKQIVKTSEVEFYKTNWIVNYYQTESSLASFTSNQTIIVILFGASVTILSTGVALLLTNAGKRASRLAVQRTKQLKESEEKAMKIAEVTQHASNELKRSQADLINQNSLLQDSKQAMFNILEDLDSERKKLSETIAQDEALIKGIGDGLIATNKYGDIILVNDKFEELTGWTAKEVYGKKLIDVLKLTGEDGKEITHDKRPSTIALAKKTAQHSLTSESLFYTRKDGTKFPVSISIAPIIRGGENTGVIEIFRDNTHEKAIDRAKSEFVSLASHQLRTPLTAINWYSDMLTAGDAGELNEEQSKYIKEVRAGSQRMVDLVNALLNVSRVDLGTFMIEPEETDLVELCTKIVQDSEPKIFERKQDFKENYPKDMPKLNIDGQLMRMVIENLVSNAIKYTPEKGKVMLSIEKDEKDATISVKDTGYGIPKAQQDKIFSKMFRADNVVAHDTEGTGLGLYLAKSVIDASGGKIWFESEENKGTTFFVKIPLSGMVAHKGSRRLDS